MLVACRLAGLSGLEAHYADVDGYGQMRITPWLSAAQASYSDVFLELIKIEGRRNRRAAIWANKLATVRRTGESYSDVTCGSLSFEAQSRLARRSREAISTISEPVLSRRRPHSRLFRTEPLPATAAKDARSTQSEKGLVRPSRRLRSPTLTTLQRTPKACSAFSL